VTSSVVKRGGTLDGKTMGGMPTGSAGLAGN